MKLLILSLFLATTIAHADGGQEQVKFKKLNVKVGSENITAEIADDDAKREHGLMFRKELKDDAGMLFIFDDTATRSFWMKNTLIALDIGYFDAKKTLIDIQTMDPASPMDQRPKIYISKGAAKYALEVPAGWFGRHHVVVKSKLEITRP